MNIFENVIKEEKNIVLKKRHDVFHIAFAVDGNYLRPAGVAMFSILKNNPDSFFHFHIFTAGLSPSDVEKIKSFSDFNCSVTIHFIDTSVFDRLPESSYISTAMYYRLIIPYALKGIAEVVLYLDADILCLGNLSHLFDADIGNNPIAAVYDECVNLSYIDELGIDRTKPYFNSGVMLINIHNWMLDDIVCNFMKIINERVYSYPDQDVLNIILNDKVKLLPKQYNRFSLGKGSFSSDTVLAHFAGYPKPWSVLFKHNDIYLAYYNESPWGNVPLDKPRNYKQYKKYSNKLWGENKYFSSFIWYVKYVVKKISCKNN
ncbi:hypothetical protein OO184_18045 [Photorhabdus sp. APURE]|uniref:glycosyltransferase family 8 protein n=1 Tax=Photorhabdus aballayi TaxID=2991723 RepID=UPI00223E3D4E|nr:glycosyltransferase [Photorhabdus aballayi]MCW7549784.1 hypothetical protein [Photorhabdus aballayi]